MTITDKDFTIRLEGSINLLRPVTPAAKAWVEEHITGEYQEFAGAIVVESRYLGALVDGFTEDGLTYEVEH